jgi:hypothetical protein
MLLIRPRHHTAPAQNAQVITRWSLAPRYHRITQWAPPSTRSRPSGKALSFLEHDFFQNSATNCSTDGVDIGARERAKCAPCASISGEFSPPAHSNFRETHHDRDDRR